MKWLKWSKHDINTIKIALKQEFSYSKSELSEHLSNHLGVDIESVKMKIRELRESERIQRICSYAREKKHRVKKKVQKEVLKWGTTRNISPANRKKVKPSLFW